jgi:1,4-dihydroxy-2-naphthoyl-CoA synthase
MNRNILILSIVALIVVATAVAFIIVSGRKARLAADERQAELIAALGQQGAQGGSTGGGWGNAVSSLLALGTQVYNDRK